MLCALDSREHTIGLEAREIRERLRVLGFEVTSRQVAAAMRRLGRTDSAPIEVHVGGNWTTYEVTPAGKTWIANLLPDVWRAQAIDHAKALLAMSEESRG